MSASPCRLRDYESSGAPAEVRYDSEYAANQTQGIWKMNKNIPLVKRARELLSEARAAALRGWHRDSTSS